MAVIKKKSEIKQIITKTFKQQEPLYIWAVLGKQVIKVDAKISTYREQMEEIVFLPKKSSAHLMEKIISGTELLNIHLIESCCHFVMKFKGYDKENRVVGHWPSGLVIHDRRENDRASIDSIIVQFTKNQQLVKRECHDIGLMGLSLILIEMDEIKIRKKDIIEKVKIMIEKESITVDCKVIEFKKLNSFMLEKHPQGGKRASFEFINPGQEDIRKIADLLKKIKE